MVSASLWENWGDWSECDCKGVRIRKRECNEISGSPGCDGEDEEKDSCDPVCG